MKRAHISESALTNAKRQVNEAVARRLKKVGKGTHASTHETMGVITEEYDELLDALRLCKGNEGDGSTKGDAGVQAFKKELIDIATACIIGVASIEGDTVDW